MLVEISKMENGEQSFETVNCFGRINASIISYVPLPWCTSKSTIAIFLIWLRYWLKVYEAVKATLLMKQKPFEHAFFLSSGWYVLPKIPA